MLAAATLAMPSLLDDFATMLILQMPFAWLLLSMPFLSLSMRYAADMPTHVDNECSILAYINTHVAH